METRSRRVSDEGLVMSRSAPVNDGDSPTVGPLKILKSASPEPAAAQPSSRFRYPPPPSSSSTSSKAALPPLPSFPLPPENLAPYPVDNEDDDDEDPYAGPSHFLVASRPLHPGSLASDPKAYNDTSPRLKLSLGEKKESLAQRRGNVPKQIQSPQGPQGPTGDDGKRFAKPLGGQHEAAAAPNPISNAYQQKPYYPPPDGASSSVPGGARKTSAGALRPPQDSHVNRFASSASNLTTRANCGSPPPPESPVHEPGSLPALPIPGDGIEARYAASGIAATETLSSLQAQNAAVQSRLAQYRNQRPTGPGQTAAARPWTPTESPDQHPHGPPTVYQGSALVTSSQQASFNPATNPRPSGAHAAGGSRLQVSVLEQDFQRMQTSTPPPAYTSVTTGGNAQNPADKQRRQGSSSASATPAPSTGAGAAARAAPASGTNHRAAAAPTSQSPSSAAAGPSASVRKPSASSATAGLASPLAHLEGHPAFANGASQLDAAPHSQPLTHTPSLLASASSPPPLPEGWIAHLDQNSGQYYYIHLATQATQWEFPKGPNPIHHETAPLSPAASTYGNPFGSPFAKQAAVSPLFAPQIPGYAESIMSVANTATPSMSGFSGPPPSAGVERYRIAPTNGVYFGPYLRYCNLDLERGFWLGSIMVITDTPQPPTIHIHLSQDLSPNPRQLMPRSIATHQRWVFWKYDMELSMNEKDTERWTYAVTSHLGCTRYEFVVAGRYETAWRILAHSNNDFAPSTSQNERAKLGGVSFMWKDVLQKNVECGGFHVQLGLGGQIYADRLWREVPHLRQWLVMPGRENRKNAQWTARHEEDVSHAYFHYYTSHFDQPFLREAFAQIPHVLQIDDHDIFDRYGSYPDYMQSSQMFKNIGRLATEMYLLFQHHTTLEILRNISTDLDLFTITGHGWHFVKFIGPAIVVVGPDCRSERTQTRVMAGPTYQGIFPKVAMLPPSVQHCLWMISVPIVYPRLDTVETLANTLATGKKVVNTTYNMVGRMTSSVAGVVGGKEVVQQGFNQVKKAVGKGGLMGGVLNPFGEIEISEELKDLWTHESKDLERTYVIRTLQGVAQQKGIRMSFLSGDVNTCGAGLVHDPSHPNDHKTMYQVIASPIVAAPAGQYLLKLLHSNRMLYVPQNGHRSTHEVSDTKEDMMEIFHTDASGQPRELKKLMGRRNYVAIFAFDPDLAAGGTQYAGSIASGQSGSGGLTKLSLAVDFVVQGDSGFTAPTKYGPVIIPHLEFGH